jgi:DNA-binding transcriptional MerR regulator
VSVSSALAVIRKKFSAPIGAMHRHQDEGVMKTVTELARRFSVSADTIRHYTKLGLLSPERDAANGYRRYAMREEKRLRFLLSAKRLGFSLKDIRDMLDIAASGDTPCPLVRKLIDQRLEATQEQMRDALRLMSRMESASRYWRDLPDRAPSGENICHLIETWDSASTADDDAISFAK